ncbi:MAG: hypothetical protein EA397_12295 [Deltaproteobacteria bacterium]|nr:MAG: hypothetical protein EA397_12295 [Deltaproteobacteria bacterium]
MRRLLFLGLFTVAPALAGPDRHLLPPELNDADCVAFLPLKGEARVVLPEGERSGEVGVVVAGERIIEVEPSDELLRRGDRVQHRGTPCAVVDITDQTLMPGLVELNTQLGLVEISAESSTDQSGAGRGRIRAFLRVDEVYDPSSIAIPVQRVEGITSAMVQPKKGLVSGRAAFFDLAGQTQAEARASAIEPVVVRMPSSNRGAAIADLHELLLDTALYVRNTNAFDQNRFRPTRADRLDLEAMIPVLRGQQPLLVHADRAADVEALLRLQGEFGLRMVLVGGAEAWRHGPALAKAGVPVVVDPLVYGPGTFDQMHARPDNAALLAEAGVTVVLSSGSTHNARTLRQVAGNAVRGGLDREVALRAISTYPAEIAGSDRGRIAPGQVANLVVFDGDPLEPLTSTTFVMIRGRPIPLDSRPWRLTLRYLSMPLPAPQD